MKDETPPALTPSPWTDWKSATPARLALGRVGDGMPTAEVLKFGWAYASARDAIHAPLDPQALESDLAAEGWPVLHVRSQAPDRNTYLRRPDLGRRLNPEDAERLRSAAPGSTCEICFVIADGLSSIAAQRHAVPLLAACRSGLPAGVRIAPVVIATQARVALADEVGEAFGATVVAILIGERPGLSSPDSLGIYLTHSPRRGCQDADRNCISNVRPQGLPYAEAARKLAWLLHEALQRGHTGVALKDESDFARIPQEDGGAAEKSTDVSRT